jgi:hypothetical protein
MKHKNAKNFLIPLKDYERIFKTTYSILKSENAKIESSCIYFSIFGANILKEHYKLDAKVHAGIAGYKVGSGEKNVLMFAEIDGDNLACTQNGFHCWVEVDGWFLDFMAPIFPNVMKASGSNESCKAMMMQKNLDQMSENIDALTNLGDFFLSSYPNRREEISKDFFSKPANTDLLKICSQWYKKPPRKILKDIPISNGKGTINNVQLTNKSVVGVW